MMACLMNDAMTSIIFDLRLLVRTAEVDLIADKELRTDDEEQDDARKDLGNGLVQAERRRNLARAALKDTIRKLVSIITMGLNLASQETMIAVKP